MVREMTGRATTAGLRGCERERARSKRRAGHIASNMRERGVSRQGNETLGT